MCSGLSDCHELTLTVLKTNFPKSRQRKSTKTDTCNSWTLFSSEPKIYLGKKTLSIEQTLMENFWNF